MQNLFRQSKKFPLFVLAISIFLSSCDPVVDYNRVIQNDSDFDIYIIASSQDTTQIKDSILIEKHSERVIYEGGGIGVSISSFSDCSTNGDNDKLEVEVISSDSLELIMDINNLLNWDFSILTQSKVGSGTCECRVILKNEYFK